LLTARLDAQQKKLDAPKEAEKEHAKKK